MKRELVLRRTYHDHPRPEDNDRFWHVLHEGYSVGSIVGQKGRSDEPMHWAWTLNIHAPGFDELRAVIALSGQCASRDACLPEFRRSFDACMGRLGDEGWSRHVQHMRQLQARKGGRY